MDPRHDPFSIADPEPPPLPARSLPWEARFPWVIQRITLRRSEGSRPGAGSVPDGRDFDLGLRGPSAASEVLPRWDALLALPGVRTVVHARQVHGRTVRFHGGLPPGLLLAPPADGHLSTEAGVLLAVSVADCVPVFLLSESPRAVGLLHAGWRGVAGGVLEAGIGAFADRLGVEAGELHLHLGPSISAEAYEVGPEVHQALGLPVPPGPSPLDLRALLAERARNAGVLPERIEASEACTLGDPLLFSHRGGDRGRQMAMLGIRAPDAGVS